MHAVKMYTQHLMTLEKIRKLLLSQALALPLAQWDSSGVKIIEKTLFTARRGTYLIGFRWDQVSMDRSVMFQWIGGERIDLENNWFCTTTPLTNLDGFGPGPSCLCKGSELFFRIFRAIVQVLRLCKFWPGQWKRSQLERGKEKHNVLNFTFHAPRMGSFPVIRSPGVLSTGRPGLHSTLQIPDLPRGMDRDQVYYQDTVDLFSVGFAACSCQHIQLAARGTVGGRVGFLTLCYELGAVL